MYDLQNWMRFANKFGMVESIEFKYDAPITIMLLRPALQSAYYLYYNF